MKFFVVSDVHSHYTEMKKALDEAGFDKDDPEQTVIMCGDCFDRGYESLECLRFINSLKRKVLVKGNHDILLQNCLTRGYFKDYDYRNGTIMTAYDLCDKENAGKMSHKEIIKELWANEEYWKYYGSLVNYYETDKYVFVHSFIPLVEERGKLKYLSNWRDAYNEEWDLATWGNPFELAEMGLNQTGKVLVHGHWHNSHWWNKQGKCSEFGSDSVYDICEHDGCIGLDGCIALSGKVNVLVVTE